VEGENKDVNLAMALVIMSEYTVMQTSFGINILGQILRQMMHKPGDTSNHSINWCVYFWILIVLRRWGGGQAYFQR